MVQGDEYYVYLNIRYRDTIITSSVISDVIVKIGSVVKSFVGGGVLFDATTSKWKIKLAQGETLNMKNVNYQVQVKFSNGYIVNSKPAQMRVTEGIIKETYS